MREIEAKVAILVHRDLSFGQLDAVVAQKPLHAGEPLPIDDRGEPFVTRAIGHALGAALGHVDLVARGPAQCLDEAVEPRCLARRYAGCLRALRSEEHTSELQSLMRISYAVFCLKK